MKPKLKIILDQVMGVNEAAVKWGLSPGTIKNKCADGEIIAKKIGKTWIIPTDHPNPKEANTVQES